MEKSVSQARVEKARLSGGGGEVVEDFFEVDEVLLFEASAGIGRQGLLQKRARGRVGSVTPDSAAFEDHNPHLEVGSLFDQNVFLGREKPEKVAAANLVAPVAEQIGASASGDEIQFEFGMMMTPVGSRWVCIAPSHAIEFLGKIKTLQHGDKK